MAKKVLIISTSLRNNANSEILAKETERGAKEAGNEVEFITLKDKNIQFCKGCLACQKLKKCVISDDANAITEKMKNADVIVWATPIYYYEMSGQMKTLIDRANSLYATGHKFKEVYLITTSAEDSQGIKLCGFVEAGGLEGANEAASNKELLEKAYNMGKNI